MASYFCADGRGYKLVWRLRSLSTKYVHKETINSPDVSLVAVDSENQLADIKIKARSMDVVPTPVWMEDLMTPIEVGDVILYACCEDYQNGVDRVPTIVPKLTTTANGLYSPLIIANSPGTASCDFRGQIMLNLWNPSDEEMFIPAGIVVAKMMIIKVERFFPNNRVRDAANSITARDDSIVIQQKLMRKKARRFQFKVHNSQLSSARDLEDQMRAVMPIIKYTPENKIKISKGDNILKREVVKMDLATEITLDKNMEVMDSAQKMVTHIPQARRIALTILAMTRHDETGLQNDEDPQDVEPEDPPQDITPPVSV